MNVDSLVAHLDQHQPRIVPRSIALWIVAHAPLGVVERFRAEGVVAREVSELVEEIV